MKMFQYITVDSKGWQTEIWACENCRKKNWVEILTGKWRLIDKTENAEFDCDKCSERQKELEMLDVAS